MYHLLYILPSGGLYATYHLLGEPESTIDIPFTPKNFPQAKTWFPTIRQNSGSKAEPSDVAGIWKKKSRISYTPEVKHGTWKLAPGKGDSYWKPSFSGSMVSLGWESHPKTWTWRVFGDLFWWEKITYLAILLVTFLGWWKSDPFKWLLVTSN